MKVGQYNVNFGRPRSIKRKKMPSTPVSVFPTSPKRNYPEYSNISGAQIMTYDSIDGIYDKTLINKVVGKIVGDATRMNYSVTVEGMDGKRNKAVEEMVAAIDVKITRQVLRGVIRDMLLYGTTFLYIQYDRSGLPLRSYGIHPKYVTPNVENGEVLNYTYQASGTATTLLPEELICFPYDAKTGQVFGNSILGPIMQILELLLNSQLNTAILIDRFAIPIILWTLDSGEDVITDPAKVLEFMQSILAQLESGNDVGADKGVNAQVIGSDNNLIDFVPTVRMQLEILGISIGVPLQLMGMRGDNLSVTTRQMQTYLNFVRDIQLTIGDILVEHVYKPYLERNGVVELEDYKYIYIDFPIQAVEENSKAITWIVPAETRGYITRTQATNALGYMGNAVPIEEIEQMPMPEVIRPGQRKDPGKEPEEDGSVKQPDRETNHE